MSIEHLSTKNEFTTGFNKEFFEIFNKNPDEILASPMTNTPGKIDASYLARLILNGDLSTWLHIANMNRPLTPDLKKFQETYENIVAYFANPDFTLFDLLENESDFSEISRFISEKFSKSNILQHNISNKVAEYKAEQL